MKQVFIDTNILDHHIPFLITRNIKDFAVDDLSVLSPQQFLEIIAKWAYRSIFFLKENYKSKHSS